MNVIRNEGLSDCVLCQTDLTDKNHTHIVRTFVKFSSDTDITMIVGVSCCVCVTRMSARQVPSPYKEEQGSNTLKESAPVPFTSQIDWGYLESMKRFAELTKDTPTARRARASMRTNTANTERNVDPW